MSGSLTVGWSGTFARGLFEGDYRNWGPGARAQLDKQLDSLLSAATACGARFGFVPHHSHLLSDVAGQMRIWHARAGQCLATVLYPSGVIAPSMVRDLDDHIHRAIEMLAPRCQLCILEDLAPAESGEPGEQALSRVPWGRGILPHDLVVALLARHLPTDVPILCMDQAIIG